MARSTKYPTRELDAERWRELARQIVADLDDVSEATLGNVPETPGRLTVLGSGIGTLRFTRDAEQRIRGADVVFYCVADAATEVWLRNLRPDAYDLYVLYNDTKRRFRTYIQMSEAVLHHVRRGRNVVCIFYGHPGIFVLSSHRGIAIARREGHHAEMLPGISALDCLCADLGVDPAYPGLQTCEATDMLLRARPIDIASHLVLWQVGLIGQLGFRRRGFINSNFNYLVDYLAGYYGADHDVTHYIASRYPTIPPTIERYRIADLHDPQIVPRFTGISTFYLAPKIGRPVERGFATAVGILKPSDRLVPPRPYRPIDRYGPREMEALRDLATFDVPPDYHFQERTGAAEFLIAVAEDQALGELYAVDPEAALADKRFGKLNSRERRLLASRQPARIQLAAKGGTVHWSPAEQFVIDLMSRPSLMSAFMAEVAETKSKPNFADLVDAWIAAKGYKDTSILTYGTALANVQSAALVAWTAVYLGRDPRMSLIIIGNPVGNGASAVYYNATRIFKPNFANNVLSWSTENNNPNNGQITLRAPPPKPGSFLRTATGKVWLEGAPPGADTFTAIETPPPDNPLGVWIGRYQTEISADSDATASAHTITIAPPPPGSTTASVTVDGAAVTPYTFSGATLTWNNGKNTLSFATSRTTKGMATVSGTIDGNPVSGASVSADASGYAGQYNTTVLQNDVWKPGPPLFLDGQSLVIGHSAIAKFEYANRVLSWSGAGGQFDSGYLNFSAGSFNSQPGFRGFVWAAKTAKPSTPNIQGVISYNFLISWSGLYTTELAKSTGPSLFIQGAPPPSATTIYLDGENANYVFHASDLSGSVGTAASFDVTLSTSARTKSEIVTRGFAGTHTAAKGAAQPWKSTAQSNDMSLWAGGFVTKIVQATDDSQVPGPNLDITSNGKDSFTVEITDGTGSVVIVNEGYDPAKSALYWQRATGTPGDRYANAALVFSNTADGKTFSGSHWPNGASPPSKANWTGVIPSTDPTGLPWWAWTLIGLAGLAVLGALGYLGWLWRFSGRGANNYVQLAQELAVCKKHIDIVARENMGSALAGDPCSEEEDDLDEEQEDMDEELDNSLESEPEEFDMGEGFEPFPDDPEVNVDVESDTGSEVEVEVESETEVDSGVEITADELFFDEDLEQPDAGRVDFVSDVDVEDDR